MIDMVKVRMLCNVVVVSGLLSGCVCLDTLSIRPELSPMDLNAAQTGGADKFVYFKFKDCCPSQEQGSWALQLREEVQRLYTLVLKDEISLGDFNTSARAAKEALDGIILMCSTPAIHGEKKGRVDFLTRRPIREDAAAVAAWQRVQDLLQRNGTSQ
jgi:hypothetical protein